MMRRVREVMSCPVVTVTPDTLVKDAAALLAEKNVSGAPVMEGGDIVGVFSEVDILRSLKTTKKNLRLVFPSVSSIGIAFQEELVQRELLEAYEEIGEKPVSEVMSKQLHTVDDDITLKDAVVVMVKADVNRLPVLKAGELVGIITRGDVIKGLANNSNGRVEVAADTVPSVE
ncbi:MAG: CBS domain-containing protein [Thermoplasmata archaeon]|nr:CBS domain-containing protein [Thermoplasmata archaeon]